MIIKILLLAVYFYFMIFLVVHSYIERRFIMKLIIHFWQQAFNFKQKISWREALSRILANLILIIILYFIALIAPPSWEEPIAYFVQIYTIISIVPTITAIISAIK